MKNRISTALLISSISLALGIMHAMAAGERIDMGKCSKHPCPNTQTGEDPGAIEAREGGEIEASLLANASDKGRWSSVILLSSSTEKQELSMPIIMADKFNLSLDPKKGRLTFASPHATQSFKISEASSAENSKHPCFKYQVRVIDARSDYALIKKTCPKQEYRPQRFYRGTDYYIYDQKTNTMRSIWSASTQIDTSTPFPTAKPEISIKYLKDGYGFDWIGVLPSDNPSVPVSVHNIYKREVDKNNQLSLVCYDVTNPRHPVKENEMCESESLERIGN
ncbi:hypothetical protein ACL58G_17170 [Massilia sp. GER05]|uniref:hypothetical protein n=1 Tax=Massilia sp. GER05 TaxID=3394605 RepID=UPI003F85039B